MSSDFYAVLGVSPDSESIVIQAAYRALMRKYHPDTSLLPEAARKSAEINEAYPVLGDAEARRSYDRSREADSSQGNQSASGTTASGGEGFQSPPENSEAPEDEESKGSRLGAKERSRTGGARLAFAFLILLFVGAIGVVLNEAQKTTSPTQSVSEATTPQASEPSLAAADANLVNTEIANTENAAAVAIATPSDLSQQSQTPVDYSNIESAVNRFASVLTRRGIIGARSFSEKCHRDVHTAPTWNTVDSCAAFDYAASYIDEAVNRDSAWAKNGYFQFERENQADNFTSLGATSYSIVTRLTQIRSAAESAAVAAVSSATAKLKPKPVPQATAPATNGSTGSTSEPPTPDLHQNQTG